MMFFPYGRRNFTARAAVALLALLLVSFPWSCHAFLIGTNIKRQFIPYSSSFERGIKEILRGCLDNNNYNDVSDNDDLERHLQQPLEESDSHCINRRDLLGIVATASAVALSGLCFNSQPVLALSQEEQDKANILKGYQRLQYLLDNWEKETTVCGMGGDKLERSCERTPLKVMDYLGYKATNDPLFKAEKTLRRLYQLAPPNRDVEFIEAVERYAENADEASGMAYISSWGEANPGGGKDRVELFIERARKNVVVAHDSLATVIDILGLQ
jgi:hypothetical protein